MRRWSGLLVLLLLTPAAPAQRPGATRQSTKVVCIGDSLTHGSMIAERELNHYPAQLNRRMGPKFKVVNYGVGGTTLLTGADRPYTSTPYWEETLQWMPDVAVVILGTNDTCQNSKRKNWQHERELEASARSMAAALKKSNKDVRVLLCSPPAMFPEAKGLSAERKTDLSQRKPRLARVGTAMRYVAGELDYVEYHDLSRVIDVGQVVDGVHMSSFGAESLAERIAGILRRRTSPRLDLGSLFGANGILASTDDYHGFQRVDFALPGTGAACTLVLPHVAVQGRPWLWRMRFFGHEPALELDLLDRGLHLAYVDVAGLYGNDEALARMAELHKLLKGFGLSARPTLLAMSRGGLPALNWANSYPKKISALVADNAVFDLRSWPGGQSGKRSEADWNAALAAHGWSEEQAQERGDDLFRRSARPAGEAVQLLVTVGTKDSVVPPAENGLRLAGAWRRRGGPVRVWTKPGQDHHPHGLSPPDPLVRAVLHSAGQDHNPAVVAVPSAEYRGAAAGWGGGTWWDQLTKLQELGRQHQDARVVFLGDSITQGLTGAGKRVAVPGGERPIDRELGELGAISLGLSGDRTEHVLYRIEHGALASMDPEVIVLQIGVNNINTAGHTGTETAAGITAVVDRLRDREPQASVVVCGPFTAGIEPDDPRRLAVDEVHELIRSLGKREQVIYLDLRDMFFDEQGRANGNLARDGIHITTEGQNAWMSVLYFSVQDLLSR